MSEIEEVTVDALIYLIAIIKNIKREKNKIYCFNGNIPSDNKNMAIIKESGFLEHMQSTNIETIKTTNKLRICSGRTYNPQIVKESCSFIHKTTEQNRISTKWLFRIIGEMMNNSIQHAYLSNANNFAQKWLLYIEKDEEKLKFTFLDTGLGISRTIHKKFLAGDYSKKDSEIVKSALEGMMTSQTKKPYRGKGLPEIKDSVFYGEVDNMCIISNKAFCKIKKETKEIEKEELHLPLQGTLYYWTFKY